MKKSLVLSLAFFATATAGADCLDAYANAVNLRNKRLVVGAAGLSTTTGLAIGASSGTLISAVPEVVQIATVNPALFTGTVSSSVNVADGLLDKDLSGTYAILREIQTNPSGGLQVARLAETLNEHGLETNRAEVAAIIKKWNSENLLCRGYDPNPAFQFGTHPYDSLFTQDELTATIARALAAKN